MRKLLLGGLLLVGCHHPAAPAVEAVGTPVSNTAVAEPAVGEAVVLVIDRSGSMQGAKLDSARKGIEAVRAALPPDAQLGVIAFDSQPTTLLELTRADDVDDVAKAAAALTSGGGTAYLGALQAAGVMVEHSHAAKKLVVILSDGEAPYDGVPEAVTAIAGGGATVSAIGIGDADRNLLSMIAEKGAGRLFMLTDPVALPRVLEKEIAEFEGRAND